MKKRMAATTVAAMVLTVPLLMAAADVNKGSLLLVPDNIPIKEEYFPDENFRNCLLEKYDTDKDEKLSTQERSIDYLSCYNAEISSLAGIGYFPNLKGLYCDRNKLTSLDLSQNTNLETLYCYDNNLKSLDLGYNTKLKAVWCYGNELESIDFGENTVLKDLRCSDNALEFLDLSRTTELQILHCSNNNLGHVDVTQNTKLTELECRDMDLENLNITALNDLSKLDCSGNKLKRLDTTANEALTELNCSDNELTELELTANNALTELYCSDNELTELDLSENEALTELDCSNNKLTALDLSGKTNLKYLVCHGNSIEEVSILDCPALMFNGLDIDDENKIKAEIDSYSQEGLSFDLATVVINKDDENGVKVNKPNFPDEKFREALIHIDPDNSGFLSADELENTNDMYISNRGIKDLTGIEFFTSLEELYCSDNELKSIDLSHNTKLESFVCSRNSDIKVNFGEISSLKYLDCNSCGLKELDVSSFEQLETLGCSGNNELTELDLSKNSKLRELSIYDTGLSSVSIADCPYLIKLLENNRLYIDSNKKYAFDTISDIYSRISVNKDAIVITSADDIAIDKTNFPDDIFRAEIQKLDSNNSGALSQNEIAAITELDVSGKEISTLKGIEYMTSLKTLNCGTNDLTSLDVSKNTALEELHCSHNSISSLIIGENANLKELYCSDNILNALDISKFPSLEVLDCDKNNIGSLDLSNNPALYILDCSSNAITDISVVDCPYFVQILEEVPFIFSYAHDTKEAYNYVYDLVMGTICVDDDVCVLVHTSDIPCNRANFPDDNFRSCIIAIADGDNTYSLSEEETADITEIKVPDMSIADLGGIENFKNLETLDCSGNRLGTLDLSNNTSLKILDCSNNQLTQLSIGTAVTDLNYSNNKLASLDLSNLTALTSLNCSGNGITALNIGSNTGLVSLDCSDNTLTSLDISKNGELSSLKCDGNDISKISVIDNPILKSLVSTYGFAPSSDSVKTSNKDDNSICADLKTAFIVSADDILIDDETVFPDPVFRSLIADYYDVDLTGTITSKDIKNTISISVDDSGVKDLKGIELFTEIESLAFGNNPISSVDLSKNTKIKSLSFEKTDVKSIDLSALTSLERLDCARGKLESLDLSNNTSLKELDCSENPSLGSLDLSSNKGLVGLACINDGLDALDLTNNKLLLEIDCRSNNISSLDVTGLVKLTYLYCGDNQIETLDLSNNELLTELGCEKNNIPEICLGGCPILSSFVEGTTDWSYDAETDTVTYGKIYSEKYLCRDFDTTVDLDELKPSPVATAVAAKAATCTEDGNIAYWYVKSTNKYYSDKDCTQEITLASTVIKATDHDWGDVKYTWSPDHSKCTAERICKNDASHIETETAVATSKVTTPATVTNKGTTTYSVVFKNSAFVAQTESVQDIPVVSATPTPKATATPTATPKVTATPTVAPTAAATATAAPTETPTATPTPVPTTSQEDPKVQILEFVKRIYIYVLDREPEKEGSEYWSNELYNFNRTGAEVAQGFIFSEEFNNRGTTDKQFVEILYKTFFGRDADEAGINFWLEQLSTGTMDRTTVANGFIYSQEWADTCASYGIRSGGDLKPQGKIEPTDLTYAFVERMYTTAMGRGYDEEGRQYWAGELANFNITGEQVGASFFLSAEMEGYKLSDQEFLNRLYATFMNREADADGSAYWLGVMASGTPRADIVYGFTRSPEFTDKCVEARILPF